MTKGTGRYPDYYTGTAIVIGKPIFLVNFVSEFESEILIAPPFYGINSIHKMIFLIGVPENSILSRKSILTHDPSL